MYTGIDLTLFVSPVQPALTSGQSTAIKGWFSCLDYVLVSLGLPQGTDKEEWRDEQTQPAR